MGNLKKEKCTSLVCVRFHTHLLSCLLDKPWSQVSSLLPPGSCLQFLSRIRRVQQPDCSSIFHRVLLTHALVLSASQFVHKKKSPRIYTIMHSGGFELTKLTDTRLEDNLIRHRGRPTMMCQLLAVARGVLRSCIRLLRVVSCFLSVSI